MRAITVAAVLVVSTMLSGCWESTDVTLHKAGEYRGSADPLLEQQAATRSESLKKRFQLVQTDR